MRLITIDSIDDERLADYTSLTEAQLRNRLEPEKGIFIAESPKVIDRALAADREPLSLLVEEQWIEGMSDMFARIDARWGEDVPVYVASSAQLEKLTGYRLHRGALAAMRRWRLPSVREVCRGARRVAVMENIVDHTNVGALMRSAAALDVDAVLVSPSSGDPLYRRAARVSMGTVFQVPWTRIDAETVDEDSNESTDASLDKSNVTANGDANNQDRTTHTKEEDRKYWPDRGTALLLELGFTTVAMALTDDSISLDELTRRLNNEATAPDHIDKLALIFGTEGDGLTHRTIADADLTVKIPMSHDVDSLNVAASSAVAFYATRVRE
ncbi:RNA methyltransferase [Bifidobacterium sp. ESL0790]|nr:RNA methyltransferase [Bifidobacterium sp. ESL0790]WEV73100.1 RNA methyltransferase [Bifidobacterium sp. ESL0790]